MVSKMLKRYISIIMLVSFLAGFGGSAAFAAGSNVSFKYEDMPYLLELAQNVFLQCESKEERYDLFMLGKTYLSTDSGIESLIALIEGGSTSYIDITDENKNLLIFCLSFVKSFEEEERANVLNDFLSFKEYPNLTSVQRSSLKDIYEEFLSEEFRQLFEQVHNRNEKMLLNLVSCAQGSFVLTDDKNNTKKLAVKSVPSKFDSKLKSNVTQYFEQINGADIESGRDILEELVNEVNLNLSNTMISKFKTVFGALGMYEEYTAPGKPSKDSGGSTGGGGGIVIYPGPAVGSTAPEPEKIPAPEMSDELLQEMGQYIDVDSNHWSAPYLAELSKRKIFAGYEDGTFRPNQGITREEIAVVLVRVLGLESRLDEEYDENFTDNNEISDWAKKSVYLLTKMGIFTGYEDGSFRPSATVTREEMAVLIARSLTKNRNVLDFDFSDGDLISDWAKEGIKKAYTFGIIKGYEDKTFKPNNVVTRAEMLAMIYNFMYIENLL